VKQIDKIYIWNAINSKKKTDILMRPTLRKEKKVKTLVKKILKDIEIFGDKSLYKYTKIFDKQKVQKVQLDINKIISSKKKVSPQFKEAILLAKKNITKFHIEQKLKKINIETTKGVWCQQIYTPIESVGLYIPGGSSPLVSTVLMLAIPAFIANCKNIFLCSPPPIPNEILYSSIICGVTNIFQMGGAQAIASLAFGTKQVPRVNKIFGPGNTYVTEAKRQVQQKLNTIDIDILAGPSELLIIADQFANPEFISWDLLSQSEHGPDSQVILVTTNLNLIKSVIRKLKKNINLCSRKKIILSSIKNLRLILVENLNEAIEISNTYSPEHLILNTKNPHQLLKSIKNAGSIFLGKWSSESIGDYSSGTNHVLPTYGSAIVKSGLSVLDFQKRITVQEISSKGLINLFNSVKVLSSYEKLDAHKQSMLCRFKELLKDKKNV